MSELNVDDYVRTQNKIFKITKLNDEYIGIDGTEYKLHYGTMTKDYYFLLDNYDDFEVQTIYKSSPNIIDLIEVGDYVNGHRVNFIDRDREYFVISFGNDVYTLKSQFNDDIYWLSKDDIKTIVTKEQFENISYKVGE